MPFSDTQLNRRSFERIRWEEAIGGSDEKECERYSGLFFSKAKDGKRLTTRGRKRRSLCSEA